MEKGSLSQESKDLLLRDLCARLPYGVVMTNIKLRETHYPLTTEDLHDAMFDDDWDDVPYLHPMSSMTEEEKSAYWKTQWVYQADYCEPEYFDGINSYDWLNKNMFDFRGLIEKGLAISTEEFNPYKE